MPSPALCPSRRVCRFREETNQIAMPHANGTIATEPTMDVAEIGRTVLMIAELPLETNVLNITIMATRMPCVGRG